MQGWGWIGRSPPSNGFCARASSWGSAGVSDTPLRSAALDSGDKAKKREEAEGDIQLPGRSLLKVPTFQAPKGFCRGTADECLASADAQLR
jgi:hypothetical protein